MTNKIEIIFNDDRSVEQDDKMRTLLGKLIAYNAEKDYLYMDLRNLVKLPNDFYTKEAAIKYWGTKIVPFEIKAVFDYDTLTIEYGIDSFPDKVLKYIFRENKDIINSIKLTSDNKIIYEVSKNDNKLKR